MKKTVLFVSHPPKQCGVYEFGKNLFNAISASTQYDFVKAECSSLADLKKSIATNKPAAIIYNYHPSVMPWLCTKVTGRIHQNHIAGIQVPQLGIIHEITQEIADTATAYKNKLLIGNPAKKLNSLFDFYVAADPTLLLKNPFVFKTGRLVPEYNKPASTNAIVTIGSFGFATPNKGFESLVKKVQEEFDHAVIRLNMPFAFYGDVDGVNAKRIAANCQALVKKPGISLEITHDFLNDEALLDFLAGNSMNVFMYEDKSGRGISSAIDNALAVKKPIAISRCPMFRHILTAHPSVCVEDSNLSSILANGFKPLEELAADWTRENMVWEFERILHAVFSRGKTTAPAKFSARYRKFFSQPENSFTWLRNTDAATEDNLANDQVFSYTAVAQPIGFNRILDDTARKVYEPTVEKLFELAPKTMAKKIARANVQQAFVFDTVFRFLGDYPAPKMLCVGSYEDTASMALQKMGYKVDEADPMINYYLQEFYTKPSTIKSSYDIIFSTSVIEHDPDDKSFLECVHGLLKPGGLAVITMDYKDGWKPGEPKPEVDARFYTKQDMEQRLMSYLPDCELIDQPDWDCPNPDFLYLGKYQYTFASFVFRKKK